MSNRVRIGLAAIVGLPCLQTGAPVLNTIPTLSGETREKETCGIANLLASSEKG